MQNRIALKITLIYFIIGFLWILFSDQLILHLAGSAGALTVIQTYKGWFYVVVTSFFLFILIRNELKIKNRIEADLIKARFKAEESDHLKSAFISNMSHEIRTPLNGILGFSELLLDETFSHEDKQVFVTLLTKNGTVLMKLINDMMDISRIQENQFELVKKKFNLNTLLDVIYLEYQHADLKATHSRIDFKLIKDADDSETELITDPVKLSRIYQNLLNNAFHFTQKGFIHFGYLKTATGIEFFVEDSGCGIDESNRPMIFKPYFKGKNQFIGEKGFGLGLAISKGLVKLLGGDLQYTSRPNSGSRFFFILENESLLTWESASTDLNKKTLRLKAFRMNPFEDKLIQN